MRCDCRSMEHLGICWEFYAIPWSRFGGARSSRRRSRSADGDGVRLQSRIWREASGSEEKICATKLNVSCDPTQRGGDSLLRMR